LWKPWLLRVWILLKGIGNLYLHCFYHLSRYGTLKFCGCVTQLFPWRGFAAAAPIKCGPVMLKVNRFSGESMFVHTARPWLTEAVNCVALVALSTRPKCLAHGSISNARLASRNLERKTHSSFCILTISLGYMSPAIRSVLPLTGLRV
jgi:hypothetical protein